MQHRAEPDGNGLFLCHDQEGNLAAVTWLNANDWGMLAFRLILAVGVGAAIGLNRQLYRKAAGLRTHILVSLGSALFLCLPLAISPISDPGSIGRAVQGVAAGVGFLGAGEILHFSRTSRRKRHEESPKVQGLTSAASIWVTAALGMVAAAGLWQIAILGTVLTVVTLSGVKWIEDRFFPDHLDED